MVIACKRQAGASPNQSGYFTGIIAGFSTANTASYTAITDGTFGYTAA